jgi:hypothetical protein
MDLKFERNNQSDDKIIAYVNMDATEVKNESSQSSEKHVEAMEIMDEEKSNSTK